MHNSSLLSGLFAARTVLLCEPGFTLSGVLQLFQPLLAAIAENKGEPLPHVLADVLTSFIIQENPKMAGFVDASQTRALRKRAEKNYGLGHLGALPTDVLRYSLSFLSFRDRISAELSCKHLFSLARDAPVYFDEFDTSKHSPILKTHTVIPFFMDLLGDSQRSLKNVKTWRIDQIDIDDSNNPNFLRWCESSEFPNLQCIHIVECDVHSASDSQWPIWSMIDRTKVPILRINLDSQMDIFNDHPSLLTNLIQRKHVNELAIKNLIFHATNRMNQTDNMNESLFYIDGINDHHLQSLQLLQCDLNAQILHYLIHPGLTKLWLEFRNESELDKLEPSQFTFLDLPHIKELYIDCVIHLDFEEILSVIIQTYLPKMKQLNHLEIDLICTWNEIFELLECIMIIHSNLESSPIKLTHLDVTILYEVECDETNQQKMKEKDSKKIITLSYLKGIIQGFNHIQTLKIRTDEEMLKLDHWKDLQQKSLEISSELGDNNVDFIVETYSESE